MISREGLAASGLVQPGSLTENAYKVRLPAGSDDARVKAIQQQAAKDFPESGWSIRTRGNAAPALPASVGALERRTAPLAHFALYALQIALPLSGWALVSVSTLEIPTMPFDLFVMPNLPLAVSDASESFWIAAHWYLAYAGIALVAVHVAAALRHHFLLRDTVLARMITPSSGGEENGRSIRS